MGKRCVVCDNWPRGHLEIRQNNPKLKENVTSSTLNGCVVSNLCSNLGQTFLMVIKRNMNDHRYHNDYKVTSYIVIVCLRWARSALSKLFQYHVVDSAAGTVEHESDPRSARSVGFLNWKRLSKRRGFVLTDMCWFLTAKSWKCIHDITHRGRWNFVLGL